MAFRSAYSLFLIAMSPWLMQSSFRYANAADPYPLREAVECHPRHGLPHFVQKLNASQSVKIAYLGGSITAAPGWRVQSREWFQKTYPQAKIEEIHAAIGGTGSDLGVFRLQNDVLRHHPDMMFVEFAVNDGGASPEQIHKAMEGIVRQTWQADPQIDICFVYTLHENMLPDLAQGMMQRSASAMEELADHYHIPSVHFGVKVAQMVASEELVFKVPKPDRPATESPLIFSNDGVHPLVETGHKLYTEALARSWPAIRDASIDTQPHLLKEPLRADNWELARQTPITMEMLHGEWQKLDPDHALAKRFKTNMPELYQAKSADASLQFSFIGTTVAVFDLLGPDGGRLNIELDEEQPRQANRIDAYCTYHRMSKLSIAQEQANRLHRVRITLTPESIDKRSILFEHNREYFDKNAKQYEENTWYIGSLLVIGQLEPPTAKE